MRPRVVSRSIPVRAVRAEGLARSPGSLMPSGVLTVQQHGPGKCAHSRTATARVLCGESGRETVSFLASTDDCAWRHPCPGRAPRPFTCPDRRDTHGDGIRPTMARHRIDIFRTHRDNPLAVTRYAL